MNLPRRTRNHPAGEAAVRDRDGARQQEHHEPGAGAGGAGEPRRACRLDRGLRSEDTEVMVDCLAAARVSRRAGLGRRSTVTVSRPHDDRPAHSRNGRADLFVANSGTTMRFLTALVAPRHGRYRLDGVPRMRERPIEDLLDALQQLGVDAAARPATAARRSSSTRTGCTAARSGSGRRQQPVPQRPAAWPPRFADERHRRSRSTGRSCPSPTSR